MHLVRAWEPSTAALTPVGTTHPKTFKHNLNCNRNC